MNFVDNVFKNLLKDESITFVLPNKSIKMGEGTGPVLFVKDKFTLVKLLTRPHFCFGDEYVKGNWTPENDDLIYVFKILMSLKARTNSSSIFKKMLPELPNNLTRSRKNVEHYNSSHEIFETMLDKDLYYSCGYFPRYGMTLEDAQREKSFHIAKKLLLEPGMNVVDIGSGWGSLDFFLASNFNVNVTGLNICEKQLEYSTKKAKELNIPNVKFLDKDYRSHNKKYDAVVSVGMLEHVGKACYTDYFKSVDKMLSEDGVALIHFIGVNSPVGGHNPWMDKNIFPGGYIPSLNEVIEPIEKTGLYITDIETWMGTHYASTLRFWVMNLENNRNKIIEKFGIEEYRKWRFYLLASETGFKYGDLVVYQIQLGRQSSRIPLSRDYMYR